MTGQRRGRTGRGWDAAPPRARSAKPNRALSVTPDADADGALNDDGASPSADDGGISSEELAAWRRPTSSSATQRRQPAALTENPWQGNPWTDGTAHIGTGESATPEQVPPERAASERSAPERPASEQAAPEQVAPEQAVARQAPSTGGTATASTATASTATAGTVTAGTVTAGRAEAGSASTGTSPLGTAAAEGDAVAAPALAPVWQDDLPWESDVASPPQLPGMPAAKTGGGVRELPWTLPDPESPPSRGRSKARQGRRADGAGRSSGGWGARRNDTRGGDSRRAGSGGDDGASPAGDTKPVREPTPAELSEKAREICLRQLSFRPRTRAELATALSQRGIPDEISTEVLDRYSEVGMIDDAAFARAWVSSRHHGRGLARKALAGELRRKGVESEAVGAALEELDPEIEVETARALVERKLRSDRGAPPQALFRRLVGLLARKGYPAGLAFKVVKDVLEEHADAAAVEAAELDVAGLDPDVLDDEERAARADPDWRD